MTTKLLANQLRSLLNEPVEGFMVELADEANLYEWRVWIEGPKDTCYDGGIFQLSLTFPKDYPMSPPELKFISDFWHPNVFTTGKVCMSILHPPGEDAMSGELPEERWLPTQSVTTIILSMLSLLNDPNCASPANVDASVEWRNHRDAFKNRCRKLVEKAHRELPSHIVIPHPESDADQHRRRVQKFHEMNKDLDYEDFYENAEEAGDDSDDENNESGDENEFLEAENEDINTDDEQSPKEMPRDRSSDTSNNSGNNTPKKEADITQVEIQVVEVKQDIKGKGRVEDGDNSDEETVATNTSIPPPSSSSSVPFSQPAQPPPSQNNINSSNNNNNNNNNNINNNSSVPTSSHKKAKKGKKGKKCVIM